MSARLVIVGVLLGVAGCKGTLDPGETGTDGTDSGGSSGTTDSGSATTTTTDGTTAGTDTAADTGGPTSDTAGTDGSTGGMCDMGELFCDDSCAACPTDAGVAGTVCNGGACVAMECDEGFFLCDATCCSWTVMNVEQSTTTLHDVAIDLDSQDLPHLGYAYKQFTASEELTHAWFNGTVWNEERIDFAGTKYLDFALDTMDRAHFAYDQGDPNDVGYTYWDGNDWVITSVYAGGVVSADRSAASIVVDGVDVPHVVHRDEAFMGDVIYHRFVGGAWEQQVVYSGTNTGLARDSFAVMTSFVGTVNVVLQDEAMSRLAHVEGVDWNALSVELGEIAHPAIHSNSSAPYAAYENVTDGQLKFAGWSGAMWVDEVVADIEVNAVSLKMTEDDEPRIAFVDGDGIPSYAWREDGVWTIEQIDPDAIATAIDLDLDTGGDPHVGYFVSDWGGVRYATR